MQVTIVDSYSSDSKTVILCQVFIFSDFVFIPIALGLKSF